MFRVVRIPHMSSCQGILDNCRGVAGAAATANYLSLAHAREIHEMGCLLGQRDLHYRPQGSDLRERLDAPLPDTRVLFGQQAAVPFFESHRHRARDD